MEPQAAANWVAVMPLRWYALKPNALRTVFSPSPVVPY